MFTTFLRSIGANVHCCPQGTARQTQIHIFVVVGDGRSSPHDDIDNGIDVGDVDLAITINVGNHDVAVPIKDDVNQGIHVSDIHLAIKVHVATPVLRQQVINNLTEIRSPVLVGPISISRPLRHMKRAA